MAAISTAFGYDVYLVPLANANVDTNFTNISSAYGNGATNFINTGGLNPYATGVPVSYSGGIFTVDGDVYAMDGSDRAVKLVGLTNASLETDTNSEEVVTYDSSTGGFNLSLPTSKSWSLSLAGVADFEDAGYHVLRLTEQNTVADALRVKLVRIGPTGTTEAVYGYGTLSGYTESIEAGSIVSWEASIEGYGKYLTDLDLNGAVPTGAIATFEATLTTNTAFGASLSGAAATLSGDATGTVDTDGSGNLTAVNIISGGSGYSVGDTVFVAEDAGGGSGSAVVATIA